MTNTTITIVVYSSHLVGAGSDPITEEDLAASADAYGKELEEAVQDAYPAAAVTVDIQHRVQGIGSGVFVSHGGPDEAEKEMAIKDAVERIAERVYDLGRFWA